MRDELARRGLAPSRARGQNFLRSERVARRLVDLVGVRPEDAAVEIGPGLGMLTRPLAERARKVVAIEVDRGLVEALREAGLPAGVELVHADALELDLGALAARLGPPVVLVANLPYAIAGRLLGELLGPGNPFRRMGLMIQAEVADRLLARPSTPDYGALSVFAALYARVRIAMRLGPEAFEPRPRVRSAFVLLDPRRPGPAVPHGALRDLVRAAFGHRRQTLRRALGRRFPEAARALEAAGIDPGRRGESLAPEEFVALARALEALRSGGSAGAPLGSAAGRPGRAEEAPEG